MLYVLIIQICTKRSGHGPLFPDPDMVLYFRIQIWSFISGSGQGPLFPDPDMVLYFRIRICNLGLGMLCKVYNYSNYASVHTDCHCELKNVDSFNVNRRISWKAYFFALIRLF